MRLSHLLALLVMNAFWAGSYSAMKALTAPLTPGQVVTWRYTLAAIVLGMLWPWLPGRAPCGAALVRTALMGFTVFTLSPRLQVLGVHLGRAGDSSVVVAIEPLITAVAAAVFLREHIPGRRWLGFLIGMSGIALLNGAWRLDLHTPALLANLVFLSSFVCETTYSVIGKPLLEQTSPLKLVACSLFFGAAFNLPLDGAGALAAAPRLTAAHWASLAFLVVVCTLIGYTLWYVVIRDCDVNLAAMTILVQPVFGVPLAAWFLGESLHWGQLWGTVVILVGLGIGLRRATRFLDPDFNGSDPGTGRRVPNGHTS